MLVLTLLYILFGINLIQVIMETGMQFYKNIRFWLVFVPMTILVWAKKPNTMRVRLFLLLLFAPSD